MASAFLQHGPSTLPRGRACATCRRRKTKCDGAQPICGQCLRAKKPEDCEYTVGNEPTQNQLLEERIRLLEARIQELTTPARANANVTLHQPYQSTSESTQNVLTSIPPSINASNSLEPSKQEAIHFLDIFLPHASEFGFFLDLTRFRESILLDLPLGHPYRPAPALTMATYLAGMFLAQDGNLAGRQKRTLAAAVQMSAQMLSSAHPRRVVHGIQAELILACYYFAQNRILEGQYHLAAAASTALSTGVLKTNKAQNEFSDLSVPPAKDSIEEQERINACWTIYFLDYGWAAALNTFPNLKCTPDGLRGLNGLPGLGLLEGGKVTAHINDSSIRHNGKNPSIHSLNGSPISNGHGSPLLNGLDGSPFLNGFRASSIANGFGSSLLTNGFNGSSLRSSINGSGTNGIGGPPILNGTNGSSHHKSISTSPINGNSLSTYDDIQDVTSLSQKAEAAFWWRYATDTVKSWRSDMTYDEIASFSTKFGSAISSLDALLASIMSTDQVTTSQIARKHILLAYNLAYGAQLLVHKGLMNESEVSRSKCLAAAASIFKLTTSIPSHSPGYVDPLIGIIWNSAGKILTKEVSRSARLTSLPQTTPEEEQIYNLYNQASQIMNTASNASPFLRKHVRELNDAYQTGVAGELLA